MSLYECTISKLFTGKKFNSFKKCRQNFGLQATLPAKRYPLLTKIKVTKQIYI